MSTGWKWVRDDGEEFKSARQAAMSFETRPDSLFIFSELSMAGVRETDATEQLRSVYEKMKNKRPEIEFEV